MSAEKTIHKKANQRAGRFLTTLIFIIALTGLLLLIFITKPYQKGVIAPTINLPSAEAPVIEPGKSEKRSEPIDNAPVLPPASEPATPPLLSPDPKAGSSVLSNLIIPVTGVKPENLRDTYADARSEGRVHNAIDIMAAKGSPVLAAADGLINRLFYSEKGGNTIYQVSTDNKWVFYYAHLDRYAENITAGKPVKKGEVIGYVGDTGNAGTGNYHLHFAIWEISDPKRIWDGENIDPYPLLRK